jgi:hypothetical protein
MLPYLGILFVPFAFASGGITYFRSLSTLDADGQRIAKTCIGLSSLLLSIQLLLWLLLYIIPESGINI